MKKNNITKRLSLRAKFKSSDLVEVVIMNDKNDVQIEMIPISFDKGSETNTKTVDDSNPETAQEGGNE